MAVFSLELMDASPGASIRVGAQCGWSAARHCRTRCHFAARNLFCYKFGRSKWMIHIRWHDLMYQCFVGVSWFGMACRQRRGALAATMPPIGHGLGHLENKPVKIFRIVRDERRAAA